MAIRTACQTITWGPGQAERWETILSVAKEAGYDGIEVGWRHIQEFSPDALAASFRKHGLVLAASHIGGNLEDRGQAESEYGMLDRVLESLNATGTSLLMYSGLMCKTREELDAALDMLSRAAERCAGRGVSLLFHNHNWEFRGAPRAEVAWENQEAVHGVMDALLERTGVGLCPDLGWVAKAGIDVLAFLEANKSRIGAVHFKDFATMNEVADTTELGKGVAPLAEAAAWIRATYDDLWVMAEQDSTQKTPEASIRENGAWFREVFGAASPA